MCWCDPSAWWLRLQLHGNFIWVFSHKYLILCSNSMFLSISIWQHWFCTDCWVVSIFALYGSLYFLPLSLCLLYTKGYIDFAIQDRKVLFPCPEPNCDFLGAHHNYFWYFLLTWYDGIALFCFRKSHTWYAAIYVQWAKVQQSERSSDKVSMDYEQFLFLFVGSHCMMPW